MVPWRRSWPLLVSVALHLAVLAWFVHLIGPPPPVLPQVELLLPVPSPPAPEEPAPSPAEAPAETVPERAPSTPVASPVPVPPAPEPSVDPDVPKPVAKAEPSMIPEPPMPDPAPLADATPTPPPPETPIVTVNEHAAATIPPRPPPPRWRKPLHPERLADPAPRQRVQDDASPTATPAAATPTSGAKTDRQTVVSDPAPSAPPAGPPPDYIGLIRGKLQKAMRYPTAARFDHQEGTVMLRFAIDRDGHLLSWRVEKTSGAPALDAEADAMVQRAAPFPPFPISIEHDRLDLLVPVEFTLKTAESAR